jgi:hypothetical protein
VTTAIIGVGKIGGALARHLVHGGEPVILAARDEWDAAALGDQLGELASAAPSRRRSRPLTWPSSPYGWMCSGNCSPSTRAGSAARSWPTRPTGFARFEAKASGLNGAGVEDLDRPAAAITSSIHPQAVGWWVLAALAGLAAIAVVGQALARQASAEGTDHPALAALGLRPRQLAVVSMLRTLAVAVAGAAGGWCWPRCCPRSRRAWLSTPP